MSRSSACQTINWSPVTVSIHLQRKVTVHFISIFIMILQNERKGVWCCLFIYNILNDAVFNWNYFTVYWHSFIYWEMKLPWCLKGCLFFLGETVRPPRPTEKLPPFLRMYLGGTPVNVTSLEKFGGCIRGFKIGDRLVDLQKHSQSIKGVVQLGYLKH